MKCLLLALLLLGVFHHLSAALLRNETYGTPRVTKDPRFYRTGYEARTFKTAAPENGTVAYNISGSYKIPFPPYNGRLLRNNTVKNGSRIDQNVTTLTPKYPRFNRTTMRYDSRYNQTTRGRSYPPFYRTRYENITGNYTARNGTYENNSRINSNATTRRYYRARNTEKWTRYPRFNRTIFMNESRTYNKATTRRSRFTPFYNITSRNISELENDTTIRNHSGTYQNLTSEKQSYPRFYRTTVRYNHRHNQTTRGRSYPSFNRTSSKNVTDTGNYTVQNGTQGNNSRILETIDSLPPYGARLNSNATTRNYYRAHNNTPKWTPMYPRFNRTIFTNDSINHNNATTRRWRSTPFYHNTQKNASENGNGTNGSDFKNYHHATHGHYLHKLYHNSTDGKGSKSRPTRASTHHKA